MLIGRKAELSYFEQFYQKSGNQLLVVYGQKNIGKTSLLLQFAKQHAYFYYAAQACSAQKQTSLWQQALDDASIPPSVTEHTDYTHLLEKSIENARGKAILIIDEFQLIVKSDTTFMRSIADFLKQPTSQEVLIILVSSSVAWVENAMVSKIGATAFAISGFYKVKELTFQDSCSFFPNYSRKEALTLYAITGGVPGLLSVFQPDVDVKTNICRYLLQENSILRTIGSGLLLEELRETAVYNTILETIASGKDKLNELYLYTGFSRAKISVYLKNLIALELVEKIFSYDTEGREYAKKGVYRICSRFAAFWYQFIFPNISKLEQLQAEDFYNTYIEPNLMQYTESAYRASCQEYLYQLVENRKLPLSTIERTGEWVGKNGIIDMIVEDEQHTILAAFCQYSASVMTYEDYEWDVFCMEQAKLQADFIYLFSTNGFDERLTQEADTNDRLVLIPY